ncbi:hypothetical protein T484DRAFT_3640255 [Baffinella frigidus]|nr:hypothetical protein T484DRAFT_3640255 [Cryptophyta sp. CCMP2293]
MGFRCVGSPRLDHGSRSARAYQPPAPGTPKPELETPNPDYGSRDCHAPHAPSKPMNPTPGSRIPDPGSRIPENPDDDPGSLRTQKSRIPQNPDPKTAAPLLDKPDNPLARQPS